VWAAAPTGAIHHAILILLGVFLFAEKEKQAIMLCVLPN
jgi:hypothetical protein